MDADHPDAHYLGNTEEVTEVERGFDLSSNVYLIVTDNSSNAAGRAMGLGGDVGKNGGWVLVPGGFEYSTVAHELGHAFGLWHDFRDDKYIMSYGFNQSALSACAAEFLAVHPYFNPDIPLEEVSPPGIRLLSPTGYPAGSRSVSVQVELSDSDGLHQVILSSYGGIVACRSIGGEKYTVVSFEYEGAYSPFDGFRSLLDGPSHGIGVSVVDTRGDVNGTFFVYEEASPHLITTWEGHTDRVMSVSFSPDGTLVASAGNSEDGTVKLWNVATREHIGTLGGHEDGGFISTAFSPNGGTLATSSSNGGIKLWDATTRTEVFNFISGGGRYVVFSPDGGTVAIASWDRTVRLWDLATKTRVANLEGHTDQVASLAFSPDGGTLASASWDRTVRLWDLATKTQVAILEGHLYEVFSVSFSPDGATLASGSSHSQRLDMLKLWDVSTRMEIANLKGHRAAVRSVAFSPDGSTLASASWDLTVRLWDVVTRKQVAALGHASAVNSVSFSPDGSILASGSDDGQVRLWDVSEWTGPRPFALEVISGDGQQGAPGSALAKPLVVEVRDQYGNLLPEAAITFTVTAGEGQLSGRFTVEHTTTDADGRAELPFTLGPRPGPHTVVVSLGGRELATFTAWGVGTAVAELEGDYRTWHLPTAATVRLGKGALGESDRAVALSADGRCLAVASATGVWLYEAATSRAQALLPSESPVHSVAFSRNGALAAGLDNGRVELRDVETGERTTTLRHADWGEVAVAFSPDGTRLASGSSEQVIKLWDVETRRVIGTWRVPRDSNLLWDIAVAFSPDGTRLVAGFQDRTVRLWDVATQTEVATLRGHTTSEVRSVSFSPDGGLVASAGGEGDPTVRLWDAATQAQVATLTGHTSEVRSVSFSPDGGLLASAGGRDDPTVRLWDVATRELINTLEEHTAPVHSVTFSPDGATLASGSADGTVLLRDVETGNAAGLSGHESLSSMALSPDGMTLASGNVDGTVHLWDVATGQVKAAFGHTWAVTSVVFSPDGMTLANGNVDATVHLWDVATGQVKATFGHPWSVTSVAFSPDGMTLASGDWNGTVHLWDVATGQVKATLQGHTVGATSVAFSPDGGRLAIPSRDRVHLWDVATGQVKATLQGHTRSVTSVAFSPDGAILASGSWDDTVRLWDVATGQVEATLQGHTRFVTSVEFSPDGMTLATGASDGTILLWDIASHLEPRTPDPDFDGNGTVGFTDFVQFAAQFGLSQGDEGYDARYDLDGNGAIGFSDFLIFAQSFGKDG